MVSSFLLLLFLIVFRGPLETFLNGVWQKKPSKVNAHHRSQPKLTDASASEYQNWMKSSSVKKKLDGSSANSTVEQDRCAQIRPSFNHSNSTDMIDVHSDGSEERLRTGLKARNTRKTVLEGRSDGSGPSMCARLQATLAPHPFFQPRSSYATAEGNRAEDLKAGNTTKKSLHNFFAPKRISPAKVYSSIAMESNTTISTDAWECPLSTMHVGLPGKLPRERSHSVEKLFRRSTKVEDVVLTMAVYSPWRVSTHLSELVESLEETICSAKSASTVEILEDGDYVCKTFTRSRSTLVRCKSTFAN